MATKTFKYRLSFWTSSNWGRFQSALCVEELAKEIARRYKEIESGDMVLIEDPDGKVHEFEVEVNVKRITT